MNSNNKPSLHRHLRKNSQPSPTSPSSLRRHHDRPRYSDPFSPVDVPSATTGSSDSPTIDMQIPSPAFDMHSASPIRVDSAPAQTRWGYQSRTSEENPLRKPPMLAGVGRPYTSDAVNTHGHFAHPDAYQQDSALRVFPPGPSPRFAGHNGRSSSEFSPRTVEGLSPNLRTWGLSPQLSSRGFEDQQKAPAQKKSRLNLLNPMSLLARRRTSQNQNEASELSINTLHVPAMPDNFDPRIRGTITHDFSTPRSRRTPSYGDPAQMDKFRREVEPYSAIGVPDTFQPSPGLHVPSGYTPGHSPMFKEHFQDDQQALRPGQTAYLHNTGNLHSTSDLETNMPAFAKRLPVRIPDQQTQENHEKPLPEHPISPPPPPPPPKHTPPFPPPEPEAKVPPSPLRERTPSPPLNLPPSSALPKHMTSTSSRFSFQIGGQASSTQEKLLEEKHKQFQASKRVSSLSRGYSMHGEFDDFDYDGDAGMEEDIPQSGFDDDDSSPFDRSKIEMSTSTLRLPTQQTWGEDGGFEDDDAPTFDRSKIDNMTSVQRKPSNRTWQYDDDRFGGDDVPAFDRSKIENVTSIQQRETNSVERDAAATDHTKLPRPMPMRDESMQSFRFTPDSLTFSPTSSNHASQPTPRDETGFAIGVADSKDSPNKVHGHIRTRSSADVDEAAMHFGGLGITTMSPKMENSPRAAKKESVTFDDNDLYFDDGEFGNDTTDHGPGEAFNEDMLDNEDVIRDIPAENWRRFDAAKQAAGPDGKVEPAPRLVSDSSRAVQSHSYAQQRGPDARVSSAAELTEDNLAAYHDLLAQRANEAAASGKFNRVSFSQDSEEDSQPGVISDESRFSNNYGGSGIAYDDGFPFDDDDDDDMDDEMMIAAANAEALENDDDGFYGQEFGFYARARQKDESEMVSGGFFAPRGSNGVKRSHSGRGNFQEPSLTPITERSEWSTRNSVASLQIPGGIPGSANSLPSPGIAQLLERDSPVHDDDMTLSALKKLRRGAFGGSSTSVSSLGASHSISSPLAQHYPHPFSPQEPMHGRMGSSIQSLNASAGIPESEEEDDYPYGDEPTLTQNTPMKKTVEPQSQHRPATPQEREMSPIMGSGGSRKSNHSRASSGAESVSYARDSDGRWVLERRRTGEDGGMEIDREYLAAGARI